MLVSGWSALFNISVFVSPAFVSHPPTRYVRAKRTAPRPWAVESDMSLSSVNERGVLARRLLTSLL